MKRHEMLYGPRPPTPENFFSAFGAPLQTQHHFGGVVGGLDPPTHPPWTHPPTPSKRSPGQPSRPQSPPLVPDVARMMRSPWATLCVLLVALAIADARSYREFDWQKEWFETREDKNAQDHYKVCL